MRKLKMNSSYSYIPETELSRRNLSKMSVVAAAFVFFVFSSLSFAQEPYLVFLPLGNDGIAPAKVLKDHIYIESLPIDGVVMAGHTVVSEDKDGIIYYNIWSNQKSLQYGQVFNEYAPLKGVFTKLNHSWMFASTSLKAGDWFDDWSTCIRNFSMTARACKELGMEGILLDNGNDQYHAYPVFEYPGPAAGTNRTLDEYRKQVRLRGKQIMEACVKEYPAFKLALMSGASMVEQGDPHLGVRTKAFELLTAFYSGLVAGAGEKGMVIDASVFYNAVEHEKFAGSYQFRKYDIPSSLHNSPSIPKEDRLLWPQRLSIGYGLCYGYTEEGMTNALKQCDYMCWYYNGADNLDPETVKKDWWPKDRFPSLGRARAAAKAPGVNNVASGIHFATANGEETIKAIPGDASFKYKLQYKNNTGSKETIRYLQKPDWVKATTNKATISGVPPTAPLAHTLVVVISANAKSDTLRLTILTSATNTLAAKSGEMITIPEGDFLMGNDNGSWEEKPQHSVYLPTYQIGKYEVTRGEYRKFMEAGGYSKPEYWSIEGWIWKEGNLIVYAGMYGNVKYAVRPDSSKKRTEPAYWEAAQEFIGHGYGHPRFIQTDNHPVVGVTYYEAEAYCNWAGGRLPTEAEYEKAARWTGTHSNIWPWGDVWDPEKSNNPDDHNPAGGGFKVNQSAPVGSYPEGASPYGCMDMVGNAYEWCADWAKSYPGCTKPYDHSCRFHNVKGGCWDDVQANCSYRSWYLPPSSAGVGQGDSDIIGFRMAK